MVLNFRNSSPTKDVSINNNKEQDFSFAPSKANALSKEVQIKISLLTFKCIFGRSPINHKQCNGII